MRTCIHGLTQVRRMRGHCCCMHPNLLQPCCGALPTQHCTHNGTLLSHGQTHTEDTCPSHSHNAVTLTDACMCIYIYIYVCVCVCVCVETQEQKDVKLTGALCDAGMEDTQQLVLPQSCFLRSARTIFCPTRSTQSTTSRTPHREGGSMWWVWLSKRVICTRCSSMGR